MPLPRELARFNRAVTNRAARPVAARMWPLANVVHAGRVSQTRYRTPVLAFRDDGDVLIPLLYGGADTDWVRNVLAAGRCELQRAGTVLELIAPRVLTGAEGAARLPAALRPLLRLLGVTEVLRLRRRG